jgi:hypothetical protein
MPRHHHRFVLEYRGKRIVSNGERFGVEAELITDCRYLSVADAKTAINSELALESIAQGRRARACDAESLVPFFSDYETKNYACRCGWKGTYEGADIPEAYSGDLPCPGCDRPLLYVLPAFDDDIKQAAAEGNALAREYLPQVLERERFNARWKSQALTKPSQLPDVDGDALAFIWDVETDGHDTYYVIRLGDRIVWRELARGEDPRRFADVKKLMKKKYGKRFASGTPTGAAAANLLGGTWGVKLVPT